MHPCRPSKRRGASFWLLLLTATVLMSIEPALFLVILALGLSALALAWILLLVPLLLADALAAHRARLTGSATTNDPMAH